MTENNSYRAVLTVKGKKINIGSFKTLEEAKQARKEAEKIYWNKSYVLPKRLICIPINYRKRDQKFEAYLKYKGIKYTAIFKTEIEAYEYIIKLRKELGIIYP